MEKNRVLTHSPSLFDSLGKTNDMKIAMLQRTLQTAECISNPLLPLIISMKITVSVIEEYGMLLLSLKLLLLQVRTIILHVNFRTLL